MEVVHSVSNRMDYLVSVSNIPSYVYQEREFFIHNLLVRIHSIIEMIWLTGLAPWEFEFPFPSSLISTFLIYQEVIKRGV